MTGHRGAFELLTLIEEAYRRVEALDFAVTSRLSLLAPQP
jgi:hypothetical protein